MLYAAMAYFRGQSLTENVVAINEAVHRILINFREHCIHSRRQISDVIFDATADRTILVGLFRRCFERAGFSDTRESKHEASEGLETSLELRHAASLTFSQPKPRSKGN